MIQHAYCHVGGETPLLGDTVDAVFRRNVRAHGSRDAVVDLASERRLSYTDLDREVDRVARALLACGFGSGSRVGIWSTDNVEWLVLQLATARVGAILVNVNPAYRAAELEQALKLAEVQLLVTIPSFRSSDYLGMVSELGLERSGERLVSPKLPCLEEVVIYDPSGPLQTTIDAPFRAWPDFLDLGMKIDDEVLAAAGALLDVDDPINIQFTSGTTGFPKAVVLSHHNIVNNGYFIGRAMRFTEIDRLCVPVPFYHCFGMVVSNLACLTHGAAIVIPAPHFDAGATLDAIERERCTAVHGVPTMFISELEELARKPRDVESLRTGIMAGAPCPPELVRRVIDDLSCEEFLVAYGQTEASPVTHLTHLDDSKERRSTTVGINLPHQETKIIDPATGRRLEVDQIGEVCFRGYHVMRGYYQQPDATDAAIDPAGWLHSGDLGHLDANGYLHITGRLKDMIIRGGENVYPAEIEAFYFEHPEIADVAVFGVPDAKLGEEIGMAIRLQPGATLTEDALREFARDRIAHFKIPRHIWIVDEFPTTVTGKIQKFRLREWAEGQLGRQ